MDTAFECYVSILQVHGNWEKRLQIMLPHISQEVKTCIEMALRCMDVNRVKRPTITEIVDELDKLDAARRSFIGQVF
jgi:pyruvate dehydrogenase phosphatase